MLILCLFYNITEEVNFTARHANFVHENETIETKAACNIRHPMFSLTLSVTVYNAENNIDRPESMKS